MSRTFHQRSPMPPFTPMPWFEHAACAETDPDAWFPSKGNATKKAKWVCNHRCPVRAECLDYALDTDQKHGVWGGLSVNERRKLKREAKRGKDAA
jgi:WhiB family redox-sensing transcriptional regulator